MLNAKLLLAKKNFYDVKKSNIAHLDNKNKKKFYIKQGRKHP